MIYLYKDLLGLRGKWGIGVGNGGEDPGTLHSITSGKKNTDIILAILRKPHEEREIIPLTLTFDNGRVIRATTVTVNLYESTSARLVRKVSRLLQCAEY